MQLLKALFALQVLGVLCTQAAPAQERFGAQGPESKPDRMQQWLVPSPDPDTPARAILYRPPGDGPFRLALIAHASTQNPLRRAQMPQSEYRALAAFLVARGFAVLVPEARAMARPVGAISRTRAIVTGPIMTAPDALLPRQSRQR